MAVTTAAVVGIAATAASTTMSFAQAGQQRRLQRQAEADAARAMEEAKKKLEINYAEELAIQKEPYELQREALLSQGAMALEAARESERGAEATAGRLQMAQTEAQAGVRSAMGEELQRIEELRVAEESRLRDLGAQINLEEAAGAQLAAREAQQLKTQATQEGIAGAISTVQQGLNMIPLFQQNTAAQQKAMSGIQMSEQEFIDFGNVTAKGGGVSKSMGPASQDLGMTNMDFEKIGDMTKKQFRQFRKELSPGQRAMIQRNPMYMQNYNMYMQNYNPYNFLNQPNK